MRFISTDVKKLLIDSVVGAVTSAKKVALLSALAISLNIEAMETPQEKNYDALATAQELVQLKDSHQKLVKRTLISNLLRTISQRIGCCVAMSGTEFLMIKNYFHYLGGKTDIIPLLPENFIQGCADDAFRRISNYGKSISESDNFFAAGLNDLRKFISDQFPMISTILGEMLPENNVFTWNGVECISTTDGSLSVAGVKVLSLVFSGDPDDLNGQYCYPDLVNITQILPLNLLPNDPNCKQALPDEEKQLSTALRVISDMYYNID